MHQGTIKKVSGRTVKQGSRNEALPGCALVKDELCILIIILLSIIHRSR